MTRRAVGYFRGGRVADDETWRYHVVDRYGAAAFDSFDQRFDRQLTESFACLVHRCQRDVPQGGDERVVVADE